MRRAAIGNGDADVEREVVARDDLPRIALAEPWGEAYGAPPAAHVSPALMRKALAWEVKVRAYGGHPPKTLRALKAAAVRVSNRC